MNLNHLKRVIPMETSPPSKRPFRSLAITLILAIFIYNLSTSNVDEELHRNLSVRSSCSSRFPLRCVHEPPEKSDVVLFWHIPKSGGTTAKKFYQCTGETIADKLGMWPQFGHHKSNVLEVFKPFPRSTYQTINVDTTSLPGMLRANEMGLVGSNKADIIFTHDLFTAMKHLGFTPHNQGRAMALFRHPIERLVSKFYYLQTASWESGYRPHWQNMTVLQWAESDKNYAESNHMAQMLSGKDWNDPVTQDDLPHLKQVLRDHVIVGLLSNMEESFRRFNIVMAMTTKRGNQLMQQRVVSRCIKNVIVPKSSSIEEIELSNKNEHDKIPKNSHVWKVLSRKNQLDLQLYEYIETLFREQKEIVDLYKEQKSKAMPF